ncbi:NUDIX hydrolase [Sorangium sp. So ce1128]
MKPVLTTLVYCVRGNEVLLARRRRPPFVGMWVAPGGKIEPHEAPWECAVREVKEEATLGIEAMSLRGIIAEVSPLPTWQWLIFIYVATTVTGEVVSDGREGVLRWWPIAKVPFLEIPESDKIFFPHIIDPNAPIYEARYVYDEALRLVGVIDRTVRDSGSRGSAI